jgi:hypothetical protein
MIAEAAVLQMLRMDQSENSADVTPRLRVMAEHRDFDVRRRLVCVTPEALFGYTPASARLRGSSVGQIIAPDVADTFDRAIPDLSCMPDS